jgi:hypothetical protein
MTPRVSVCRECKAAIVWARTEKGKRMPVDPVPVDGGRLILIAEPSKDAGVLFDYRVRAATAAERAICLQIEGAPVPVRLWRSHFSTCPAEQRRRHLRAAARGTARAS